ncbi:MAG: phosphoserine phosphatase SerB [Sneathiella sp.]|nr:phosphoserine phosphatase SerB [Sneathiella sp.]
MTTTALTLVKNPNTDLPLSSIVDAAMTRLKELGAINLIVDWLHKETACDLLFDGNIKLEDVNAIINQADYCLQPTHHRKKKLLLADMDSTIITVECIDELADFAGIKKEVSAITEQAMNGELDFNDAFRARVAMLKGLSETVLQQTYDERVTLMAGARTLIQTMKANGTYCALVSGGFTFFTNRIREEIGFDMDDSNELIFEDGKLTGDAAEPILNSEAKLKNLNRLLKELNLDRMQSVAIGDGANDIPMIEAAGLGVSYHAKPKAADAADAMIRFGDLTTLLYFQGYKKEGFVS